MTTKNGRRVIARAGVCLLILVSGVSGRVVQAEQLPLPYVMTVFSGQAQGELVLDGDYERAIRNIESAKESSFAFATSNNLCVALTKAGELEKAFEACDAAVVKAAHDVGIVSFYERGKRYIDRAVALTNRGVVRAVSGDEEGAGRDFAEAARLSREFEASAVNLALLAGMETPYAAAAR